MAHQQSHASLHLRGCIDIPKLPKFRLPAEKIPERQPDAQVRARQSDQLAKPLVPLDHPQVRVEQRYPIRHAGERRFQLPALGIGLGLRRLELGIGAFERRPAACHALLAQAPLPQVAEHQGCNQGQEYRDAEGEHGRSSTPRVRRAHRLPPVIPNDNDQIPVRQTIEAVDAGNPIGGGRSHPGPDGACGRFTEEFGVGDALSGPGLDGAANRPQQTGLADEQHDGVAGRVGPAEIVGDGGRPERDPDHAAKLAGGIVEPSDHGEGALVRDHPEPGPVYSDPAIIAGQGRFVREELPAPQIPTDQIGIGAGPDHAGGISDE